VPEGVDEVSMKIEWIVTFAKGATPTAKHARISRPNAIRVLMAWFYSGINVSRVAPRVTLSKGITAWSVLKSVRLALGLPTTVWTVPRDISSLRGGVSKNVLLATSKILILADVVWQVVTLVGMQRFVKIVFMDTICIIINVCLHVRQVPSKTISGAGAVVMDASNAIIRANTA